MSTAFTLTPSTFVLRNGPRQVTAWTQATSLYPLPYHSSDKYYSMCRTGSTRRLTTHMNVPRSQAKKRPIASRIASVALKLLIESLCTVARDVQVDVNASSNLALLTGRLNGVTVQASSLVYNNVAISGGVALYTDEIILSSAGSLENLAAPPRLTKPFSVSVRATLTESDLNRQGPLRDALQMLLQQIVTTGLSGAIGRQLPDSIGGVTCTLENVYLLDSNADYGYNFNDDNGKEEEENGLFSFLPFWPFQKTRRKRQQKEAYKKMGSLVMEAKATLGSGRTLKFAVRSGITTQNEGHIVKLADPHFIWNGLAIPMITINMIGVQLDSTSKLTNIIIDNGRLSADGILVISPPSPRSRQLTASDR